MTKPKLHLDGDISSKPLLSALLLRGHGVTRTPQDDLPMDATDDYQLLWATSQGRILVTHNIKDFIQLAVNYPRHQGVILANQESFTLSQLITLLDRVLTETSAEEWVGQVRWLSDWKR